MGRICFGVYGRSRGLGLRFMVGVKRSGGLGK